MSDPLQDRPAIRIFPGIGPLLEGYDGLILDLWGVIHDGRDLYPGVTETLARITETGTKVVMLSNAPRRSSAVIEGMSAMGIDRALYTDVLSSGELTWRALKHRTEPWARALGNRCLHIGPDRDLGLLDGLDLEKIGAPEAGAFILNTGPWADGEQVADYESVLGGALACAMPMICANPDMQVIRAGTRIICAGALAARYAEMGGEVHYFGKPYGGAYTACLELMAITDPARLLAVGDSFATDIRGAVDAGVASVLVTSGIHGAEMGLSYGEQPSQEQLQSACAKAGVFPAAAIAAFTW
ncbi:MAG: TIGR01459 family HAD-type hydrolase [Alphaproteobacteria bacterium]|nr:TIGR01459 family HAD-type hydrolase [Alphaproteobacteria bacterium]